MLAFAASAAPGAIAECSSVAGTDAASPERRHACTCTVPPFSANPLADLLRVGRRVGREHGAGGVEHRHVPVAVVAGQAHLERRRGRRARTSRVATPAASGPVGAMAGAGVLAGVAR